MQHKTMDRKTFLKWLGALLMGLCSGRDLRNVSATTRTTPPRLKEARHYRTGRDLAG
ncbi:MAG TPA: hypothetical protein PLT76_07350 [Candidatus Omnitrophota bacterium]|nr:hypothetical protein [Candidatus Omnitrophota bacterium]